MSYRAAYDHSETIAALASLAGASHVDIRPAPENPVHILQIHGTNDGTIAYEGADIAGNAYPSAKDTVAQWAEYNGCGAQAADRELRDLVVNLEGHESSVMVFNQGCKAGGSCMNTRTRQARGSSLAWRRWARSWEYKSRSRICACTG